MRTPLRSFICVAGLTGFLGGVLASTAACSMSDIVGKPGTNSDSSASPDVVKSYAGAQEFYRGAVSTQSMAVSAAVPIIGVFTDELIGQALADSLDRRILPEGINDWTQQYGPYSPLQRVRVNAREARGVVTAYAPGAPPAWRGHLYAIEAFADVMLAELYCSGIPLSTVEYGGDFTLSAGSSTAAVYQTAIALYDSAIALSADSTRIQWFARVGKARALLGVGQYAEAAAEVANVPTTALYQAEFLGGPGTENGFSRSPSDGPYSLWQTVSDGEGGNGTPYIASNDPRSASIEASPGQWVFSRDASGIGMEPITLTSGVEARLIEAEAELHAGHVSSWLAILNALRTDGTVTTSPNPSNPALLDTVWNPGTGGVAGLAPLRDPALDALPPGKTTNDVRVDRTFRERAEWLFLTGHRQGDLRRLVRNYHRQEQTVYPDGLYNGTLKRYGDAVNLPVPTTERTNNNRYTGCINRGA